MRPNFLFLLMTFFAVTTATAQLYDNRSRYLQRPSDYSRFEMYKTKVDRPARNSYFGSPSRNSYSNYSNRVSRYAKPNLNSNEFYNRFRSPGVYNTYNLNVNTNEKSLENELNTNDCHCNFVSDVVEAYDNWKKAMGTINNYITGLYEELFEKKIENIFNKQFPDFKSARKYFFNEYTKIGDDKNKNAIIPVIEKDYVDQFNLLEKNTAFYNVAKANGSNSYYERIYLQIQQAEIKKIAKEFLISKKLYESRHQHNLPYRDFMVDKFIMHYDEQENDIKLGIFNGYIEHYQNIDGYGTVLKPTHKYGASMLGLYDYNANEVLNHLKNRIKENFRFYDYKLNYSLEYSKAIVAFYNMKYPYTIYRTVGRGNRIPVASTGPNLKCQETRSQHDNPQLREIKQTILNKTLLKKAVFKYLENAKSHDFSQKTVLEAVGCRLKNSAFEWSELPHLKTWKFQQKANPEVIMEMKLKKRVAPNYFFDDGIDGEKVYINGVVWEEYYMHKGIAEVLKYSYNVEKHRGAEGATIRHFLKQKGLNVPSSLSNYDLGTLFDFGGGNTNTLTIEFSDYAKKHILNFQHYDGKYGTSLFTDLVKLKKLYDILKERPVDFSNNKKPCPGDPVQNPEIAPQKNSGIAGGMYGCTRNGSGCAGQLSKKYHGGMDFKAHYGQPIFAMYDGVAKLRTQYNKKGTSVVGAGHYVEINSTINGKTVKALYFHLKKNNRKSGKVKAGDVIGYLGDSGNLKTAIKQGYAESHLHVKVKESGSVVNPNNYLSNKINPKTGRYNYPSNCK